MRRRRLHGRRRRRRDLGESKGWETRVVEVGAILAVVSVLGLVAWKVAR